ncbi:MAG: aminotransferase class V-fold PLP-dependent enzyme [Anaerolineae bacterium]|nr:aminotransferase class V-fold PLP-dependent enzyme [Thermoflexales bacterium]MDW8406428.1 aminotransferase class V-fold PLP-dependent enzyme [Anaerolineae bacterium]
MEIKTDYGFKEFLSRYPTYADTSILDEMRTNEYARLDAGKHVYLDYTGGSLYADCQLREHMALLRGGVFGNPHSANPASRAMTELVEHARQYVLRYFNASPQEYVAIFTANASGALKLVGESYPFSNRSCYVLTFDNHNSVNGIREFARAKGARITYLPVGLPDMRADNGMVIDALKRLQGGGDNLFAYPAQSNFSGVQHPLEWIEQAHAYGWDVLLDAAAFTPTNRLDLSQVHPDFVSLSFYKIFGYPTGVGCLLARRMALQKLRRPWFAGGTITVASVQGDKYYLGEGEMAFEDGTLNYLTLPAVEIGLKHIESIGIDTIHERVRCLTGWVIENLLALRHHNGKPVARLYGPANTERRGGTITFNFYGPDGRAIDHRLVEQKANAANISLRTGCFCNPGGGEIALGLEAQELAACFRQPGHEHRLTLEDFRLCIDGKSSGAVRASLGIVSNFEDAQHFLRFAEQMRDTA